MRIRDPINEVEEPFNLVPLTDMVFNLLIFFMAATTFTQVEREMGLSLPKASAFASMSAVPQQLVININEQGQPIVSHKTLDLVGLEQTLLSTLKVNPKVVVIVRADERGRVGSFAAVMDVCKKSGVQSPNLSYVSGGK